MARRIEQSNPIKRIPYGHHGQQYRRNYQQQGAQPLQQTTEAAVAQPLTTNQQFQNAKQKGIC